MSDKALRAYDFYSVCDLDIPDIVAEELKVTFENRAQFYENLYEMLKNRPPETFTPSKWKPLNLSINL